MDHHVKKKTLVFIGSYAPKESPGVYVCVMNEETGELSLTGKASGLLNPTFLEPVLETGRLYALEENTDSYGERRGAAVSFGIDFEQGMLSFLNREKTAPASTCHLHVDRTHRCLMTASYHKGMVSVSPLTENGLIGPVAQVHQHSGSSVLPVQSQARAHSIFMDKANRYALVCDLGLDKIVVYRLEADAPRLVPHGEIAVAPGAGPRHFAFHPQLPYGYVINELNSTITAFHYDEELGQLTQLESVPALPDDYQGENSCADIHISPDGRFLYGSNRGHDSIVVYAIDPGTGKLALVEWTPTLGGHPRSFGLSPDGRMLLTANRDGNNVVSFYRDEKTGRLRPTGASLTLSKPVCVKFLEWQA